MPNLPQVEESLEALLSRQSELQKQREDLQRRFAAERRTPKADYNASFAWDTQLQEALTDTFSLPSFRQVTAGMHVQMHLLVTLQDAVHHVERAEQCAPAY